MQDLDELKQDVKHILRILLGNGEIGVCEQVRDNKQSIERLQKNPDELGKWVVRGISFLTFCVLVYITFIK